MDRTLGADRIGSVMVHAQTGLKMTCIEYKKCSDIIVKFEDNTTVHSTWDSFKRGVVRYRVSCEDSKEQEAGIYVGYSFVNNAGQLVTITGQRGSTYRVTIDKYKRCDYLPKEDITKDLIYYPKTSKEGYEGVAYNGIPFVVTNYQDAKHVEVKFADSIEGTYEWQTISRTRKIRQITKQSKIGVFSIESFAFRLESDTGVYYTCKCDNCGLKDILTPIQMLEHQCNS